MKRLVRTGASSLPPAADSWVHEQPVAITHRKLQSGKTILVKTYCGVEITCIIRKVRGNPDDPIYDVSPVGDLKVAEFRKAGVPVDDNNARNDFVAFDWQIVR